MFTVSIRVRAVLCIVVAGLGLFLTGFAKPVYVGGRASTLAGPTVELGKGGVAASNAFAQQFPALLNRLEKATPKPVGKGRAASVSLQLVPGADVPARVKKQLARHEAYWLRIENDPATVTVIAATVQGLAQGAVNLITLLEQNNGRLQAGEVLDWPEHRVRAVHVVLRYTTPAMIRRVIDASAQARMNMIIMQLADGVQFESKTVKPLPNAMSKQDFIELVRYAREMGLVVIPEVKLLTHQEKFLRPGHPELLFNQTTYDPRNPRVYELIYEYLEELIAAIQPDAIHIGHDEVKGITEDQKRRNFKPGEQTLDASLYIEHLLKVHEFLTSRSIQVWMWGDMLISSDQFPRMRAMDIHGNSDYTAIRNQVPRDIIMCDWHYKDTQKAFPSAQFFAQEGFEVMGSTWYQQDTIKNFSRYANEMTPRAKGMIATIWSYMQRREWDVVEAIIRDSGEAYWYAN